MKSNSVQIMKHMHIRSDGKQVMVTTTITTAVEDIQEEGST